VTPSRFQYHATSRGIWVTQLVAVGAFEKIVNDFENRENRRESRGPHEHPLGNALGSPFSITAFAVDPFAPIRPAAPSRCLAHGRQATGVAIRSGAITCCSGYSRSSAARSRRRHSPDLLIAGTTTRCITSSGDVAVRHARFDPPAATDMAVVEMHIPVRLEWGDSVAFRIRAAT